MSRLPYRPEIDGLRAIAVLSVVLYHMDAGLPAGLVGVDLFFVISGYLITALLHREWRDSGSIDLPAFYARRVRRIVPAMALMVVLVAAASLVLLNFSPDAGAVLRSAAAALLFVANIFFQTHTGSYFDSGVERMPLLHLWSLGVEEQFYLLWPLALTALLPRTKVRRLVACLALASLLYAEWLILQDSNAAFYQMPARLWELAAGGLIALGPAQPRAGGGARAAAALFLILVSLLLPIGHFPGLGVLPAVAGAALLLHTLHGSHETGWSGVLLRSPPLRFLGRISYSLYLWHWPLLALARATHAGPLSPELRAALCAAAVGLAWLSYRWIEQPARRPFAQLHHRSVVAGALIACAALGWDAVAIGNGIMRSAPSADLASLTAADLPQNRLRCNFRGTDPVSDPALRDCRSSADKPLKIAIWGDSHAFAWLPLAWSIAQAQDAAAIGYTRDACAPLLGYDNGKRALEAERCREFNDFVAGKVGGMDTLIMTALWPDNALDPGFGDRLEATMAQIAPQVRRIVLLGPTPYLHDAAPHCIAIRDLGACGVSRQEFDRRSAQARTLLQEVAAKYGNVEYVELGDFFCDADTCPAVRDGHGLYWDSNHVASTAARQFAAARFSAVHGARPPRPD